MADLTGAEKRKLESFLGMKDGVVLNFTNSSFKEFVYDITGIDIYDARYAYESGSKANRLRAFWRKEDNATVGKLLKALIEETDYKGARADGYRQIAERLLPSTVSPSSPPSPPDTRAQAQTHRSRELTQLKDDFFKLAMDTDRSRAGLALETLLNRLFTLFELEPRQPFRVVGEQIDGSFQLDGHVYLLESKWEQKPLPEADLLVFRGKIEGKSTFTRGVMIALNDVSIPARDAITRGKAPSFFVMNGHDLTMVLSDAMSLTDFLRKRVRLLAEEGRVCVHFTEL